MAYLSTDVTRNDPVFGSRFIGKPADKKTFPDNEQNAYDVYQVVHDELYLDGQCTTEPGDVLPDFRRRGTALADGSVDRQKHDRQG